MLIEKKNWLLSDPIVQHDFLNSPVSLIPVLFEPTSWERRLLDILGSSATSASTKLIL